MAEVIQIKRSRLPEIYPLLHILNPDITREVWDRLFSYDWQTTEDYIGLGLLEDDNIVGFLGFIFSERMINGQREKFCNLTTWIVLEEYRNQSLMLAFAVMQMKGYTFTNLSPSVEAYEVFKKLGFKELDRHIVFLPFLPLWKFFFTRNPVRVTGNLQEIEANLDEPNRRIFQEHLPYKNCKHFLLKTSQGNCYIVTREATKGRWFWFTQIYYISDSEIFWEYVQHLLWHFVKVHKTFMTLFDERFIDNVKAGRLRYVLPGLKLFKSHRCQKADIDYLYSEKLLLNR
jgi:hypothetical protein